MIPRIHVQLAVALVVAGLHTAPAWAQDAPSRPFKGLFGGNERAAGGGAQRFDFTASLQAAQDDNVLADEGPPQNFDPRFQVSGVYSSLSLGLAYDTGTAGRAVTFSALAGSDVRYAPSVGIPTLPQHHGAVSMGLSKTKGRFSFNAQQGATYLPYRSLSLLLRLPLEGIDAVAGPGQDFAISSHRVYGVNSAAGIGMQLGRRAALNLGYTRMMTDYSGQATPIVDQGLNGGLSYRMTRHASLRLGYGYRLAQYSGSPGDSPVVSRNIDAGVDYNRPLSLSRKTFLSFSSGSTATSDGNRTVYHATGGAALNHEIGRSWNAQLLFSRAVSFLDGFATPFLTTGVTAKTGGYVGRHVDIVLTAGYADAESGLSADGTRYETLTGAGRIRLALSRYGSLYAQYFHYQYRFTNSNLATSGLPPSMERRGLRGGFTVWLPLLR